MDIQTMRESAEQACRSMPWISGIKTHEEYEKLLSVMDKLVEDYDTNHELIDLLFPIIERYEDEAPEFAEFNEAISKLDSGAAMLRVIIDQHGLKYADLKNEIGSESLISLIVSEKRQLTIAHIKALSKRFNIPAGMFI